MATCIKEEDDIITLKMEDGRTVRFMEIAGIVMKGKYYLIMQPLEDDESALVFLLTRDEAGEEHYQLEKDEETIEAVFAKYDAILSDPE